MCLLPFISTFPVLLQFFSETKNRCLYIRLLGRLSTLSTYPGLPWIWNFPSISISISTDFLWISMDISISIEAYPCSHWISTKHSRDNDVHPQRLRRRHSPHLTSGVKSVCSSVTVEMFWRRRSHYKSFQVDLTNNLAPNSSLIRGYRWVWANSYRH